MAQTGILDYKRYLNTLQTLTNLGQTFPSNQQTYNFAVAGGGTASWPATISWETLILDKVSYSSQATGYVPNVDNSQVIGFFEGSTATQYSSGVISIPANMYTGPILPGGNFNVPLTVVHLEWFDGVTTYAQQIGFIQNWEPGVEIGDPTEDFNYFPVYSIPSTLTLTGEAGIVYGDNLTLTATTDMAIDLGVNATRVRFFRVSTGTDVVLGTSFFTGTVATLVLPTNPSLPIGNYNIYAVSQPRGIYRSATSNTLNVRVEAGVPLIVTTSTFTPNLAYYFPGHSVRYDLGVIADPAFTATGVAISNPVSIKLVNGFSPFTETNILNSNFVNGQTSANFTVDSSMIDVGRLYPETQFTITTSTQNSTRYTATLFVSNVETVASDWGFQTAGRYRNGSTSTTINVATSTSVTVVGQPFPLTITQSSTSTYFDEAFDITVSTNTATYYTNISLIANNGSTSTVLFSGNNSGTSSFTVTNVLITTTGTWSIFASYPGDLGMSLINANLPSTSNTLTHIVRLGNDLLPTPIVTLERTPSNDIVRVSASTSTTLVNTVTFLYNVLLLDTSSWVRTLLTTSSTFISTPAKSGVAAESSGTNSASGALERNFDSYRRTRNRTPQDRRPDGQPEIFYTGFSSNTGTYDLTLGFPTQNLTRNWKWDKWAGVGPVSPIGFPNIPWWTNGNDMPIIVFGGNPNAPGGSLGPRPINGAPYLLNTGFDFQSLGNQIDFSEFFNDYTANFVIIQRYTDVPRPKAPVLHNARRLFKYYNGSNYNLSAVTGTNISEILDPLTEGTTWFRDFIGTITTTTKEFTIPSVIHAPLNSAPTGAPAGSSGVSRLIDYIQDGPVQVDLYDIYRIDTIGTANGYNVIALDSRFYGTDPTDMTEANPRRLYFRVSPYTSTVTGIRYTTYVPNQSASANNVKTRYIDLVEYIGEVEWTKPFENAAQKAGTQARSTIKVKLFRFTPTIPQANTQFKTNAFNDGSQERSLPDPITTSTYSDGTTIPNNGFRIVKFSTSQNQSQYNITATQVLPSAFNLNPSLPNFGRTPPFPTTANGQTYIPFAWIDNWQDPATGAVRKDAFKTIGRPSANVAGAPYSSVEENRAFQYGEKVWASTNPGNAAADNLAEFYNEWSMAFGGTVNQFDPWGNITLLYFDPIYSTNTFTTATNTQVARIDLAAEAIPVDNVSTNLHARWPGTLSLPLEYGRYNPFDIYATPTPPTLDYLVVGGGGGGGGSGASIETGGGGGAGAMNTGTTNIIFGQQYNVIVGAGGVGFAAYSTSTSEAQTVTRTWPDGPWVYAWGPQNGQPSSFGSISAVGGGYGATADWLRINGNSGGSGGGGSLTRGFTSGVNGNGGAAVSGQGNSGGNGIFAFTNLGTGKILYQVAPGGGGGAGGAGGNGQATGGTAQGGAGGLWKQWFDGNFYAGGGAGGVGGYSTSESWPDEIPGPEVAHYGNVRGGGGRGQGFRTNGQPGQNGIVIIRVAESFPIANAVVGATITVSGGYRYYSWTSTSTVGSIIF
jgi:hypothetical protein